MHILITDSGVGGLSVCAYAERFVRTYGFEEPVRLTFANAAPENDYGYNAMPSRAVKVQTFDRFLRNVTDRYAPDLIYVACNTLSVLLPDTQYSQKAAIPVKGIVEPVDVYELTGTGPARTRLQAATTRGLSRFVGRHAELGALRRALENAQAGHGQLVGVVGEPGMGKSRLAAEIVRIAGIPSPFAHVDPATQSKREFRQSAFDHDVARFREELFAAFDDEGVAPRRKLDAKGVGRKRRVHFDRGRVEAAPAFVANG